MAGLSPVNQGLPNAEFNLGSRHLQGTGVNQNYTDSLNWLRKAADAGLVAEDSLGVFYLQGDHVPQDYSEAAKWFQKAANQGDAESQYNLGLLLQWRRRHQELHRSLNSLDYPFFSSRI